MLAQFFGRDLGRLRQPHFQGHATSFARSLDFKSSLNGSTCEDLLHFLDFDTLCQADRFRLESSSAGPCLLYLGRGDDVCAAKSLRHRRSDAPKDANSGIFRRRLLACSHAFRAQPSPIECLIRASKRVDRFGTSRKLSPDSSADAMAECRSVWRNRHKSTCVVA
jgi:hypothetical protein